MSGSLERNTTDAAAGAAESSATEPIGLAGGEAIDSAWGWTTEGKWWSGFW